jgi:5'-3' exonuclease
MGIPSYFSHIIKNYSNIIRSLNYFINKNVPFHHLYMDCNSIIYDSVYKLEYSIQNGELENPINLDDEIIKLVISKIKYYIELIKPSHTVYIAFDGVAPFAKMEQQRTRRYKTWFMKNIDMGIDKKQSMWNTSAITPGTQFMNKLSKSIEFEFNHTESKYKIKNMIVSCSNEAGEGEHKLFEHLRKNNFNNDNVAVYGLDADLIMLSIFHLKYCNNVFVFRETPEFLKNSIPVHAMDQNNPNEPHFLDIRLLSNSIMTEMKCKYPDSNRIYDYVFMCFFLGNDFLPHFPAMNIRTHGIQALLDIYRLCIGNTADRYFISKTNGAILWKNVGIFVNEIAKREHEFLLNEYFVRDKLDKRKFLEKTPSEKEDVLLNTPIIYRAEEKYICPQEPKWEQRYYKTLFHFTENKDEVKNVCINYLEGLEWVYKYYTDSCPDWRWKYKYHYPPLFSDLIKNIPHFEMNFVKNGITKSFSPYTQLAYVLPKSNLELLPNNICEYLKKEYSELYPDNYGFQWAFCRYLWESHPLLPEISDELLEQWDLQFTLCT